MISSDRVCAPGIDHRGGAIPFVGPPEEQTLRAGCYGVGNVASRRIFHAPASPATAKSEDALSGKTPPKDERGGKEKQIEGHESGWVGHGKTPEETKAEPGRNEVEGQGVKKP